MQKFLVKATVTVDVAMEINAETSFDAIDLFNNELVISAGLVDTPTEIYTTVEESIENINSWVEKKA